MKQTIESNIWSQRISAADRYYKKWEAQFKCTILENYYEGIQYKSQKEMGYNPYVINKIYETIQIKISQYIPDQLKFQIAPKLQDIDDFEAAVNSAQLKEDVLNYIIADNKKHFTNEFEEAYKDSFFRFGIMEVGYSADWIQNPQVQKPFIKGQKDKNAGGQKYEKVGNTPEELPKNERVYFKHIKAKRFRIGGIDHKYLDQCGWCGYYDFIDKNDLLSMKKLMNRDKINSSPEGYFSEELEDDKNLDSTFHPGALKLWHLWDMRSMTHSLVLHDNFLTVFEQKFKRIPLFDLRPDKRLITEGFYPIPPVYHWLSAQDEINETRESLRSHRRRFVRKFQVVEGMVDDEEIQKFETGPDGALIKVKQINAIVPIENADLGSSQQMAMEASQDDLNRISGESDPSRGVSERGTATEANIVAQQSSTRQKKDMGRLVAWLTSIGREALLTVKDNFAMGIYIEAQAPEGEDSFGEVEENQNTYKWVDSEKLNDGFDFKIDVDIVTISATAQQDEQQRFLLFLSLLNQYPLIAFSPILVRETAYRVGYRNMKAIREFQKQALLMQLAKIQQLSAAAGQSPQGGQPGGSQNPQSQQVVAGQTPPQMEQIRNQISKQLPVGGGVQ